MSEITYTKGEWKLTAGRTIETERGTFYITYGLDRDRNPLWKGSFSELDRNVQLMSAAPDLLAACKALLNCPALNMEELDDEDFKAIKLAQDALDKALGL